MNLQEIQKRIQTLTAELAQLGKDLSSIVGEQADPDPKDWAANLRAGDLVVCTQIISDNPTRNRCFTVGKTYTVEWRLTDPDHRGSFYGVRIMRDDENEGHDATGVIFKKVEA